MGNNGSGVSLFLRRVDDKRGYQGLIMDLANRCYIHSLECVYNNVQRMNSSVIASPIITDEMKDVEEKLKVGKHEKAEYQKLKRDDWQCIFISE
jgi:hypothetical protein